MTRTREYHSGLDYRHEGKAGYGNSEKRHKGLTGHQDGVPKVEEMHLHGVGHAVRHAKGPRVDIVTTPKIKSSNEPLVTMRAPARTASTLESGRGSDISGRIEPPPSFTAWW